MNRERGEARRSERPPDPGFKIERVQIVQQQNAAHQVVGRESVHKRSAGLGAGSDLQHPFETGGVKVHHRLNQFERDLPGARLRQCLDLRN